MVDRLTNRSGWRLTYPSEKYESVEMMTFPIYEKMKHVPNQQPGLYVLFNSNFMPIQTHLTWRRMGQIWKNCETTLELDGIAVSESAIFLVVQCYRTTVADWLPNSFCQQPEKKSERSIEHIEA